MPFIGGGSGGSTPITTNSTLVWTPVANNETYTLTADEYGSKTLIIVNAADHYNSALSFANSNGGHVFFINNTSLVQNIQVGTSTSVVYVKPGKIQQVYVDSEGKVTAITNDSIQTLKTFTFTPEANNHEYILSPTDLDENGILAIAESEFSGATLKFTNITAQKTYYIRNLNSTYDGIFGNYHLPKNSVAQILVDATGAVTVIQAPELYEDVSVNNTPITIVAANNSSAAWKTRAEYTCTGSNDHTIINAALTAYTGGTVVLAPGTFYINGSLNVPASTDLIGASATSTIISAPSWFNMIIGNTNSTLQKFTVTNTATTGSTSLSLVVATGNYVTMDGLTVTAVNTSTDCRAIYMGGQKGLVNNCSISSKAVGVYIAGGYNTISNSTFNCTGGNNYVGTTMANSSSNVHDCYFGTSTLASTSTIHVNVIGTYHDVANNYIGGSSTICISVTGEYNNIKGNVVAPSSSTNGIILNANYANATGNFVTGCGYCLRADSSYGTVADNILVGSTGRIIWTQSASVNRLAITNNKIVCNTTTEHALYFSSAVSYLKVLGNDIQVAGSASATNSSAIYMIGGANISIKDNVIWSNNNYHSGIRIYGNIVLSSISGNIITQCSSGIYASGSYSITYTGINNNVISYYNNIMSGNGIYIESGTTVQDLVINGNNILKGTTGTAYNSYGIYVPSSSTGIISGNNISFNSGGIVAASMTYSGLNRTLSVG